jgi:hypothetical protein
MAVGFATSGFGKMESISTEAMTKAAEPMATIAYVLMPAPFDASVLSRPSTEPSPTARSILAIMSIVVISIIRVVN